MRAHAVVAVAVACLTAAWATAQAPEQVLAYEVLEKHIVAMGGEEAIRALETTYTEGILILENTGLSGEVKVWRQRPNLERQEVDLGFVKTITGDNGTTSWVVDANGKARLLRDNATLNRRRLQLLRSELEHRDPSSEIFDVTFQGVEKVDDSSCYVLRTTNTLNDDVEVEYINHKTYLVDKSVTTSPDGEETVRFSDYQEHGGVMHAFVTEIESLPVGQRSRFEIVQLETNVPVDMSLFEPPGRDAMEFRFLDGRSAESVPFELVDDHILLRVSVGGRESLWVLDSGAESSVISAACAEQLGLESIANVEAPGVTDTVDASYVNLPALRIHSIEFDEQRIASATILDTHVRRFFGFEIGGILGYDFLSHFVTRIDYANRTISFFRPEHFSYDGPGVVIDAPIVDRTQTLPVVVDGHLTGTWAIDLGDGAMSFHYPFAEQHQLLERSGVDRVGFDAAGTFRERRVRFGSAAGAGLTVDRVVIHVPRGQGSGGELAGSLGNGFLRHFVVYLDYERRQVVLEKGDDFARRFPGDRSGLQVVLDDDDRPEIVLVAPGTPAAKAGAAKGDRIVAVNGLEVELLAGLGAIRQAMRAQAGTSYTLLVERNGQTRQIELTLRDLL